MIKKSLQNGLLRITIADTNEASSQLYEIAKDCIMSKLKVSSCTEIESYDTLFSKFTVGQFSFVLRYDNWVGLFCTSETIAANPIVEEIATYIEKDWKERGIWEKLGYK